MGIFPNFRGENKNNILTPPPRWKFATFDGFPKLAGEKHI